MKIRDVLSPTDIIIDVRASDKTRLLEQLSTQAAAKSGLAADEVAGESLNARSLDRPALATAWRFLTRDCGTSKRPSASSQGRTKVSILKP
jgi:hypothetical protein